MVGVTISSHSALGTPATLTIAGHPTVRGIVVSRDLGDATSRAPTLRGMPCLLLDFTSEAATDAALARLTAVSSRLYHKHGPTRIACGGGVQYTLRVVHGFDEAAIAAIERHHADAVARYEAAQHAYLRGGTRGRAR